MPSERRTEERTETTVRVGSPRYGGLSAIESEAGEPALPSTKIEVPFAIEGERVHVGVPAAQRMGGVRSAEVLQVLEPAPERVSARCVHFGICGGCQYQHLAPGAQRTLKARLLREMLEAAGIALPAAGMTLHGSEPWGYRNRIRLRVEDGALGYSRRATNAFLPVVECPIASPLLWRAAEAIVELIGQGLAAWPEGSAEIELSTTEAEDGLQLALHLRATIESVDRAAPAAFRRLCDALKEAVPQLRGAGLLVQGPIEPMTMSRRVQERQRVEVARWGEPGLLYRVSGRQYPVSRNAFFQVNRFLTERMVGLVVGRRTGALALDLYAGAGLFALPLTERYARVVAVEMGEPAASNLAALLRTRGAAHRAERQTTLAFLRSWTRDRKAEIPDLVVMDPPRFGLGPEVVAELLKLRPREMVYVSCDPTTFARDAKALVESGYAVEELHALDLFPQTFHMETIAVFRR